MDVSKKSGLLELNDEYDVEVREQIRKVGETYVLDGLLTVRDANRHLGLKLPENDSYTTIAIQR